MKRIAFALPLYTRSVVYNHAYQMVSLYCLVYPMIAGAAVDVENPRALDLPRCTASRAWTTIEDHNAVDLLPR
jgi:hypothetical protein